MSIGYDKNRKSYYVRWRITDASTGEVYEHRKRGFATKKEARAFEEEVQNRKESSSFENLAHEYIQSLEGYANEETRRSRIRMLEMYASELLPMNVLYIKRINILRWRSELVNRDISLSLKNTIMQTVKAVSKFGHNYYDYPDFASVLKAFPKSSDDVSDLKVIPPEDFRRLSDCVKNEVYRRFFIFLYHTGMRRGEALALLKEDVDGRYVTINKSYRRARVGRKSLKNASSKRTIQLDDKAYEMIGPLLKTEGEYVFGEHAPLSPTHISRQFNDALEKAGLPHYRVHDLRHSFVSNAILNGADIVTVSKYVGHSNIEQTLNTYSHLLKDSENKLVGILNNVL